MTNDYKKQYFKVLQRHETLKVTVPSLKLSNTDFIKKHKNGYF